MIPEELADSPEDTVIRKLCVEKLQAVMEELAEADAYLLYLLFFEEVTVKEAAQLCGCSRKTITNRRKRILKELNEKLKAIGIRGGCFYKNAASHKTGPNSDFPVRMFSIALAPA